MIAAGGVGDACAAVAALTVSPWLLPRACPPGTLVPSPAGLLIPAQLHALVVSYDLTLDLSVRVRITQPAAVGEGEFLQMRAVPAGERVIDGISELFEKV